MANKKQVIFKRGDKAVACPRAVTEPNVAEKLFQRTGLSIAELTETPMTVIDVDGSQVKASHPKLSLPVVVCERFLARVISADHPAA